MIREMVNQIRIAKQLDSLKEEALRRQELTDKINALVRLKMILTREGVVYYEKLNQVPGTQQGWKDHRSRRTNDDLAVALPSGIPYQASVYDHPDLYRYQYLVLINANSEQGQLVSRFVKCTTKDGGEYFLIEHVPIPNHPNLSGHATFELPLNPQSEERLLQTLAYWAAEGVIKLEETP